MVHYIFHQIIISFFFELEFFWRGFPFLKEFHLDRYIVYVYFLSKICIFFSKLANFLSEHEP